MVRPLLKNVQSCENIPQTGFYSSEKRFYGCGLEKNQKVKLLPKTDIHHPNIEIADLSVKLPQTFTNSIDKCPFENIQSDNDPNIMYCNARRNTNTSGGECARWKREIWVLRKTMYIFSLAKMQRKENPLVGEGECFRQKYGTRINLC